MCIVHKLVLQIKFNFNFYVSKVDMLIDWNYMKLIYFKYITFLLVI